MPAPTSQGEHDILVKTVLEEEFPACTDGQEAVCCHALQIKQPQDRKCGCLLEDCHFSLKELGERIVARGKAGREALSMLCRSGHHGRSRDLRGGLGPLVQRVLGLPIQPDAFNAIRIPAIRDNNTIADILVGRKFVGRGSKARTPACAALPSPLAQADAPPVGSDDFPGKAGEAAAAGGALLAQAIDQLVEADGFPGEDGEDAAAGGAPLTQADAPLVKAGGFQGDGEAAAAGGALLALSWTGMADAALRARTSALEMENERLRAQLAALRAELSLAAQSRGDALVGKIVHLERIGVEALVQDHDVVAGVHVLRELGRRTWREALVGRGAVTYVAADKWAPTIFARMGDARNWARVADGVGESVSFEGAPWLRIAPSALAGAGRGLFAARAFPQGALLVRYEGEVCARAHGKTSEHVFAPRSGRCLDGAKGIAGMINWSPAPNAKLRESGGVYSLVPIAKGEELTISYGTGYWSVHGGAPRKKKRAHAPARRMRTRRPPLATRMRTRRSPPATRVAALPRHAAQARRALVHMCTLSHGARVP